MVNVLVCDDEKDIVSALRIYLESEGYQVYTAYDGLEALEVLETKEIHLVLLDVMMATGWMGSRPWQRFARHLMFRSYF